jgi:DHA1 family bicyclomycin/chloramphenicol resistance-like MFS transporter
MERSDVQDRPPGPGLSFAEFVGLTAMLMALTAVSIDIMLPALPDIGAALGVDQDNERQLVVILYMAGFSCGQLVYGPLSDRWGRRPVLMVGLLIFVVGTLGALFSGSFSGLLAARMIQGVGAASPRVVSLAIVRDVYGGRQMARVMSFAMMVFIIIPVFAPSIGQGLLHIGN